MATELRTIVPATIEGIEAVDCREWPLTPHVCRTCLGRVCRSGDAFRCVDCGVEAQGAPEGICGCGIQIGFGKLRDRRLFHCAPNPRRSPNSPAEMGILFGDIETSAGLEQRKAA